jgi:hypothetical protein
MSAETPQTEGTVREASTIKAPELDVCNHYVENISLVFDPKRVLLPRTSFINEDYSKYVSVGFYPARDYQPLVEFEAYKKVRFS